MEFSGRLSAFPPANILQWASHELRTGALLVRRSSVEKRIFFRGGRVVGCLSTEPGEHFGQHLLLHGHLDERGFLRALDACKRSGRRLGSAVVELGLLSEREVARHLHDHISDVVCDLFLWQRGVFFFTAEPPPEEEIPARTLETMQLVMEGTRWLDEMARIRRVFVHDQVVLRRGAGYPGRELSPLERRIAATVDGGQSLEALRTAVRGSYFRLLEAAYRLCLQEVLDIATIVELDPTSSTELRLVDLLLEQAADEERALLADRRLAVPLAVLADLYPTWVDLPSAEQWRDLTEELARFCSRLDGRTRLDAALAADPEIKAQELDLFQVELGRGRLALLPVPADELESRADDGGAPAEGRWWRRLLRR